MTQFHNQVSQQLQRLSEIANTNLTDLDMTGFIRISQCSYMPWNGYRIYRFYDLSDQERYEQDKEAGKNLTEGDFYARPYRYLGKVSATFGKDEHRAGYVAIYKTISRMVQVPNIMKEYESNPTGKDPGTFNL